MIIQEENLFIIIFSKIVFFDPKKEEYDLNLRGLHFQFNHLTKNGGQLWAQSKPKKVVK